MPGRSLCVPNQAGAIWAGGVGVGVGVGVGANIVHERLVGRHRAAEHVRYLHHQDFCCVTALR